MALQEEVLLAPMKGKFIEFTGMAPGLVEASYVGLEVRDTIADAWQIHLLAVRLDVAHAQLQLTSGLSAARL